MKNGAKDIKSHRWFSQLGINWNDVYNKVYLPPIQPRIKSVDDTSNFDDYNEDFSPDEANESDYEIFNDFWFLQNYRDGNKTFFGRYFLNFLLFAVVFS